LETVKTINTLGEVIDLEFDQFCELIETWDLGMVRTTALSMEVELENVAAQAKKYVKDTKAIKGKKQLEVFAFNFAHFYVVTSKIRDKIAYLNYTFKKKSVLHPVISKAE
jgi:hypothetical protein